MPNLTTGNTRAGGLATWPARWSFLLLWSTGVALVVIDSPDSVFDPKTLVVFAAALVGALLLTTPTPGPLRPCLLYTSPSPRDRTRSRMPSSA